MLQRMQIVRGEVGIAIVGLCFRWSNRHRNQSELSVLTTTWFLLRLACYAASGDSSLSLLAVGAIQADIHLAESILKSAVSFDTPNSTVLCTTQKCNKTKWGKDSQNQKKGGGGIRWCPVDLTMSDSDDDCKLQKKRAENGNANFTMGFQQDRSTASGGRGSFLATAMQEANAIGHSAKPSYM